jgi:UDP-2-acetamido-2-deoxy-ribo-hexuluronate aminotransferase
MQKIQMVDLGGQYAKIKTQIDVGIQGVIDSCSFINGPEVTAFKSELEQYLGVKHVVPCANGTDALQIAMMALGLKPGDEVITADFTYVATAEVIALLGLTPVLVDVNPDTFNIDPLAVEKAITPKTKAIVPVHLFGQCADMEILCNLAKKHNLFVIEDTAQAIGSKYTFKDGTVKQAGTMGTVGCTSFFPSKNLGCYGDGGALFTNDTTLYNKIKMIANHGQSVQYHHDSIGVNSRLDSIQAAILRVKLRELDAYILARNKAASHYDSAFGKHPKIKVPVRNNDSSHVFHQYTLQLDGVNRAALKEHLAGKGIPAMIYYPIPLHCQKAYADPRHQRSDFVVTDKLCQSVISLPMHTELDATMLNFITEAVLQFIN